METQRHFVLKDLPDDIVIAILAFIPRTDLWSPFCVCRRWRAAIESIFLATITANPERLSSALCSDAAILLRPGMYQPGELSFTGRRVELIGIGKPSTVIVQGNICCGPSADVTLRNLTLMEHPSTTRRTLLAAQDANLCLDGVRLVRGPQPSDSVPRLAAVAVNGPDARVVLTSCNFVQTPTLNSNVAPYDPGTALLFGGGALAEVRGCKIENFTQGVKVEGPGTKATFVKSSILCYANRYQNVGLVATGGAALVASGNKIAGCKGSVVTVHSASADVADNDMTMNSAGLVFTDSHVRLERNSIRAVRECAVVVRGDSLRGRVIVKENKIESVMGSCVHVAASRVAHIALDRNTLSCAYGCPPVSVPAELANVHVGTNDVHEQHYGQFFSEFGARSHWQDWLDDVEPEEDEGMDDEVLDMDFSGTDEDDFDHDDVPGDMDSGFGQEFGEGEGDSFSLGGEVGSGGEEQGDAEMEYATFGDQEGTEAAESYEDAHEGDPQQEQSALPLYGDEGDDCHDDLDIGPGDGYSFADDYGPGDDLGPETEVGPGDYYGPEDDPGAGDEYEYGDEAGLQDEVGGDIEFGPEDAICLADDHAFGDDYGAGDDCGPADDYGDDLGAGYDCGHGDGLSPGDDHSPGDDYYEGQDHGPGDDCSPAGDPGPGEYDDGSLEAELGPEDDNRSEDDRWEHGGGLEDFGYGLHQVAVRP